MYMVSNLNKMTTLINSNIRSVSLDHYINNINDDLCNECNNNIIANQCNKCGNGVCYNIDCSYEFPHYYNKKLIVCKGCFNEINNKLINYDHLLIYKFLKNNMIRKRRLIC